MLPQGLCQPGSTLCPQLTRVPASFHHSKVCPGGCTGAPRSGFWFKLRQLLSVWLWTRFLVFESPLSPLYHGEDTAYLTGCGAHVRAHVCRLPRAAPGA